MKIEEWLGEQNTLGIDIWKRKYQYEGETFDAWLDRVSGGDEDVKRLIKEKKFLFAGRILSNRGLNKIDPNIKYSTANCYVLTPPQDSIESIFDTAKAMARTYSYGGGVGIDLSQLAPRGAKVSNSAKYTTGSVSFMDLYSLVTGLIGQANRRGALMLSLSCEHPDFEEFIGCKTDLDKVTKANISIRITDDFMKAVKDDKTWEMSFTRESTGETVIKRVPARELFRKIADVNWDYAEPGMLFWDTIENYNLLNTNPSFKFVGTNPSLRKGTQVLTDSGIVPIETLEGKTFKVMNLQGQWSDAKCFLSGHDKPLYKLTLSNGKEYYCTGEHKWPVRMADNTVAKVETTELKKGYEIPLAPVSCLGYGNKGTYQDGLFIGFLYGDGSITTLPNGSTQYGFTFGSEKINEMMPFIIKKLDVITGIRHSPTKRNRGGLDWYETASCHQLLNEYMRRFGVTNKSQLPEKWYSELSEDFRKGFIDGLFSADGWVDKSNYLGLSNKSHDFIEAIRDYLMWYGIRCSMHDGKTKLNGNLYDITTLQIAQGALKYFKTAFRLSNQKKQELLDNINDLQTHKTKSLYTHVVNVELTSLHEDVWDITVFDTTHCFRLNGCMTGNCGEEPLGKDQACCLGSINLANFVTQDKRIDYNALFEAMQIVLRGMNDVLIESIPLHPLAAQRTEVDRWRQVGVGIMGLADMLIKLEIPYGSPEAVDLCNRLGSTMAQYALYASAMVAKDQGAYPEFNLDEVLESSFYKAHQSPEIEAAIRQFGLANSQILTIAPTGTLSTMLGISGGIEPIFANYYTRKTESLHGKDVYYKVYTPIVEKYMKEHNITDDKDLPEWFVTAQEIPYRSRIDMQAAWQKHIDASISSTVNLPHEATVEDVEDLYMYAWEKGLKGITVYRDGCARAGILTTGDTKKEEQKEKAPTPANEPETELIGYKRKLMTGCGALHLCAFFNRDGELRETYLSKGSLGGCQNYMIGLSRMISLAARNGVSVPDIVDQLKSCGSCPSYAVRHATKGDTSKGSCCPVAVGNALLDLYNEIKGNKQVHAEKIVEPETPVHETTKEKCPECGAELRFEGGCMSCPDCGWSRCG